MNLYVGNLSFKTTDTALKEAFQTHGQIEAVRLIADRDSGRSKGFGFVDMPNREEAMAAIKALHGTDLDGRTIVVNEARPRPEASERRNGGGFGNGDRRGGDRHDGNRRSY